MGKLNNSIGIPHNENGWLSTAQSWLPILILSVGLILFSCKGDQQNTSVNAMDTISLSVDTAILDETPALSEFRQRWSPPDTWTEVRRNDWITLDLRYASEDNFVKKQMYECPKCFLRTEVVEGLKKALTVFKKDGYGIILYDCYRPRPVQQELWNIMPNPSYVTPPHRGSMHNRGLAMDIGLIDSSGQIIDMGTEFDYFGKEAHFDHLDHPQTILDHRRYLRKTLADQGFKGIRTEWWHFSMPVGQYELSDWEWSCDDF